MSTWASCFWFAVCSAAIVSIFCAMLLCLSGRELETNCCAYQWLLYCSIGPLIDLCDMLIGTCGLWQRIQRICSCILVDRVMRQPGSFYIGLFLFITEWTYLVVVAVGFLTSCGGCFFPTCGGWFFQILVAVGFSDLEWWIFNWVVLTIHRLQCRTRGEWTINILMGGP